MIPGRLATACVTLGILLATSPPLAAAPPYVGRPLQEVLAELAESGLTLVYSSDLVRPEMRVLAEPAAESVQELLEELLGPHHLAPEIGPRGHILIVRGSPPAMAIRFERPTPGQLVTGRLEVALRVDSEEPVERVRILVDGREAAVLEKPPFRTVLALEPGDGEREIAARVEGRWGGSARASVAARQYQVTDSVEIALREVFVTVSRHGRPLRDLVRDDFLLVADGEPQELVTFGGGDLALAAAVLVDLSPSMTGSSCELALAGARGFLARLSPEDRAMVLAFSDRALAVTPFGARPEDLSPLSCPTPPAEGTILNDSLYAGLRLLDGEAARRVVVLLTDGADVSSVLAMDDVLWKVERSTATIFWIRLGTAGVAFDSAWRDAAANLRQQALLEQAVARSGGRIIPIASPSEIAPAFAEVIDELRSMYVLGFYSTPPAAGDAPEIRVLVKRQGVEVGLREAKRSPRGDRTSSGFR